MLSARRAVMLDADSYQTNTVCSQLSKPQLSVSRHLDIGSRLHVFSSSGKNTLRSLEFCYRRKQSCCMNNFPDECSNAFSIQYKAANAVVYCITAWQIKRRGKYHHSWLQSLAHDRLIMALSLFYRPRLRFRLTLGLRNGALFAYEAQSLLLARQEHANEVRCHTHLPIQY